MSIATEFTRINNNIANAYTAANSEGATMPETQNSDNLATCIRSITKGGGGGSYQRPSDWLTIPTMDGTTDDIYVLLGVGKNCLNKIMFRISGAITVDWGDGNTETMSVFQSYISHVYDYDDLPSSSWTEHNNSRQALIHISSTRGGINYFWAGGVSYSYTNADGRAVSYNSNIPTDIYQVSANVSSCDLRFSDSGGMSHKKAEIFEWEGTITGSNVSKMFYNCFSIQKISKLKMPNATDISAMFYYCRSLKEIPEMTLSANVTNTSSMFDHCESLQKIPKLDTSKVTNMQSMFQNCYSLEGIDELDTSKATFMNFMFNNCYNLQRLPKLNTSSCTNMATMFSSCYLLQTIPPLNTSNVTNMGNMFYNCYSMGVIPPLDASSCTSPYNFCAYAYSLNGLKLYNLNPNYTSSLTLSNLTESKFLTHQALVDLFNSVAPNTNNYSRTIQIGSTLQSSLANVYVKDSGNYYTIKLPTNDTSIQSGKIYYTYDMNTDTYTQVTPDFTTDTIYHELKTATWNEYVICESTDTGAMLALDFARNIKGYTIT